ncbi:MAG: hypothetical protein NTU41_11325 [Chloroflexi bacterium]|nr:hypothetical protein [Chloroflexota bacterium]
MGKSGLKIHLRGKGIAEKGEDGQDRSGYIFRGIPSCSKERRCSGRCGQDIDGGLLISAMKGTALELDVALGSRGQIPQQGLKAVYKIALRGVLCLGFGLCPVTALHQT